MYFDYAIVLAFALFGGVLLVIANRRAAADRLGRRAGEQPADPEQIGLDGRQFAIVLVAIVLAAGIGLLFPWALVLRDCLHDRGAAQSRGIGALALLEGAIFLAMLVVAFAYVWKRCDLGTIDSPDGRKP